MLTCINEQTEELRKNRAEYDRIVEENAELQLEIARQKRLVAAEIVQEGMIIDIVCMCSILMDSFYLSRTSSIDMVMRDLSELRSKACKEGEGV